MTSAIDPTKPVAGNPTTQSVRDNFAAAKSEIEALQSATENPPAFRALLGAFTKTTSAAEKLPFPTESFDTNNYFNTTTSQFRPTAAGTYQINWATQCNESGSFRAILYKNGAPASYGTVGQISQGGDIIKMNGTTDYLEIWMTGELPATTLVNQAACFWSGFRIGA